MLRQNYRNALPKRGSRSMLEVNFPAVSRGHLLTMPIFVQATTGTPSSRYLIGPLLECTMTRTLTKVKSPRQNRRICR